MAAGPTGRRDATQWGLIASGQGGCRIASQLFTRTDNPGIDDRVVLINTNETDIQESLDRVDTQLTVDRDDITRNHVGLFGPSDGTGNDFLDGEQFAEEGFDEIFRAINNTAASNALMYTVALGGGTGNGSTPYIIDQFRQAPEEGAVARLNPEATWLDGIPQFVLAAWPGFRGEGAQRYFNGVCGLSRLLMREEDGSPNADMTILASNARLRQVAKDDDAKGFGELGQIGAKDLVNRQIISALDLFISAGRLADDTIDVKDYARQPQARDAYHGTFGTALDKHIGLDLDIAIKKAVENTFVPLDPSTAEAAYVVVRVPEHQQVDDNKKIMSGDVGAAFEDWKLENGLDTAVGMHTLSKSHSRGTKYDVLVFLAGFDLTPLMEESRSWERYESERDRRERNSAGDRGKRIRQLEENLRQYRNNLEG